MSISMLDLEGDMHARLVRNRRCRNGLLWPAAGWLELVRAEHKHTVMASGASPERP